jgi:hypothetical protein
MLLIYEDDADRVAMMDERMPNCSAYTQAMIKAGIYVAGDRLRGVTTATTVRLTHGKAHVVDGPYAEAKEQLGGFHIIAKAVAAMMKYNQCLQKAGVLLALDGLHPPSMGARVSFSGGKPKVTHGPFTETQEVLGGYWMIQVGSKEEAIEWASRCPLG